ETTPGVTETIRRKRVRPTGRGPPKRNDLGSHVERAERVWRRRKEKNGHHLFRRQGKERWSAYGPAHHAASTRCQTRSSASCAARRSLDGDCRQTRLRLCYLQLSGHRARPS